MMQNDVLDLARQSAASDLAFLLKAKEQAKARLREALEGLGVEV